MQLLTNIITTAILLAIYWLLTEYFPTYYKKKGENKALKEDASEIEYESEKGKNLATKEDIEEITEKIEQVKSEISFKNQWQQDHIRKREERLIHILHLANKISMSQNRIVIKSRNAYNVDKLFELIDEIDSYAVELADEGNMLIVDYHQFKGIDKATRLIDTVTKYAAELSCLANNVANTLQMADFFKNRALENDTASSTKEMQNALLINQQAQAFVEAPLKLKEPTKEAINSYICWLEQLYGKGVLVNYQVTDMTKDSSVMQ